MSVSLMTIVFNCNMPELKTDDGKTVPDTTAKFVLLALADNANDEGEGSYPGVDTLCKKTNYSTATVCNALNALRHNGFTQLVGKSKYDTNNYTVLAAKVREFQWLKRSDFSGYNPATLAAKTDPSVKPSVNPSGELPKKDLVDGMLEIGQMPGAKKQLVKEYIAGQIRSKMGLNPSGKDADSFIDYAAGEHKKGNSFDVFLAWWLERNPDPTFWSFRSMEQKYPLAFFKQPEPEPAIVPEVDESQFIPNPYRRTI